MRLYGQYPEQLVLYVGNEPLRMQVGLDTGAWFVSQLRGLESVAKKEIQQMPESMAVFASPHEEGGYEAGQAGGYGRG